MSNTNQNIYSKPCVYNCGIQIYWNTLDNAYFEVFTKKRHLCPNRVNKLPSVPNNASAAVDHYAIKRGLYQFLGDDSLSRLIRVN